ncbi:MAG: hypothetical protein KatS3mg115_1243 [Candidatus Poribacteria bacterium]|nr:MAG: hypothetical protein KatS3mg115_1243 [Candidatus Poribacteria bacterium]
MLGQEFALHDIPTVITLIFLEGLLSADNALVLAILVQGLPKHQQKKGLLYGLVGAFVLRGLAILVAATLMRYWWIEAGGAAYLMYLAIHHFAGKAGSHRLRAKKPRSFWPTVVIVELTDLAFAIDSILAAVGLVGPAPKGAPRPPSQAMGDLPGWHPRRDHDAFCRRVLLKALGAV